MCKDHRLDHLDYHPDHGFEKYKKINPGVKSQIDPWASKMNGLTQAHDEIIDSDSLLADKVTIARKEAIIKNLAGEEAITKVCWNVE